MFYTGVVEDRLNDPLKLGRCRVRIIGFHTPDKLELPTEDLPWASVMLPVNSAVTSGLGDSPTGLVEGATVIVIFQDEWQQQPIIIGSVPGIQAANKDQEIIIIKTSESLAFGTSDGITQTGESTKSTSPNVTQSTSVVKKPTGKLVPSQACYDQIRAEESLSSIIQGQNKFVNYSLSKSLGDDTPIYPYKDSGGVWTIGWGNTFLANGKPVTSSTQITKKQADSLLVEKVLKEFAPGVLSKLSAPVTQSMYDALVAIAYNVGVAGLAGSAVMSAVNTLNYEVAASQITILKTNNGLLSARRNREKQLFQKDGFPRKDMSAIDPPPNEVEVTPNDASQNPVVSLFPPGVIGDEEEITRKVEGFRDPNGVYPKIVDEPDTNRLARHENVDKTVVFSKESARVKDIKTGGFPELGEKTHKWTQPKIPYNASYPYNHVYYSESGHIQEFDDTEGSERIHTYHRAGTYEEIDTNGTVIRRIVGDTFEIQERNGHVLIKGTMNVTIMGDSNVRIENKSVIDVLGDVKMTVGGNLETGVTGDFIVKTDGKYIIDAKGMEVNIDGDVNEHIKGDVKTEIDGDTKMSVSKSVEIGVKEKWRLHTGVIVAIDSGDVAIQSNAALDVPLEIDVSVEGAENITMGKGPAPGVPEFPEITAPSRLDSDEGQYETPDDGDPAEYEKKLNAMGAPSNDGIPTQVIDRSTPELAEPAPLVTDCSMIPNTGPIDRQFTLSQNFKLSDLDKNNSLSSAPVVDISKAEIVCNLKALASNCLEPIVKLFPSIIITSGYRNYVPSGGATNSDHLYGAAVDIVIGGFDRAQHYAAIQTIAKALPAFTQLILEYRGSSTVWIHVAFNEKRGLKMQKLTMNNGVTVKPIGTYTLLG